MPAKDIQTLSRGPSDQRLNRRLQTALTRRQIDSTNIKLEPKDTMGETKIASRAAKRSSRNLNTPHLEKEEGLTLEKMRSARKLAIKGIQAKKPQNQDVVVVETTSRRHSHRRPSRKLRTEEKEDRNARSLSPTRDLEKPARRARPSVNEKARSSETRARTSLALRRFGELSSSLNNGSSNWAESSSNSVQESTTSGSSSSSSVEQQTQRMKILSEMFHSSKEKLQQTIQDSGNAPTTAAAHLSLLVAPKIR